MKTDLAITHLSVRPGSQGSVSIEVVNTSEVIDGITAIVDGINPDWIRLDRPVVSLFPDSTEHLDLVFDIPTSCPAGDYLVLVRIVSTVEADRQSVHDFWLTVEAQPGLEIELRPSIVTGGADAIMGATIVNTGNAPLAVNIEAIEPTREIDCVADPSALTIPQGGSALVDIRLRGPRPWFGEPRSRTITVTARADDISVEQIGTFRQKARIPRGVLTALILAMIVLLWALIFLFVISGLQRRDPPAKAVGTGFITGLDNIPLLAVAATAEGTVTASTTGDGIARITVEAFRITADGTAQPVGSAATDDDGAFSLKSLIPGTYTLRFSADGFSEVWFPDAVSAAGAEQLSFEPTTTRRGLDVVLSGTTGRLLGQVEPPPGAPNTPLQVTATLVDGPTDEPPFTTTIETTDGTIDLGGLPTPGTYQVTVTGDGFQTQQFEQTLNGGQASVLNTVNVTAADGSITGTVLDGSNNPVGNVVVTARSGDIELSTITPTTGNVGQFTIIGLTTPQTYVLTFAQSGATSTTAALSLAAGERRTGVVARLVGGSGTVTGSVVAADGSALGGISIRVLGDNFDATTSTLTTTGPAGAAGSFTASGLPVPGNYTFSLSGPGLQTETVGATFTVAGPQSLGVVTLLPDTAVIQGTVSGPSGGLGSVTVTLSDGTARTRVTTSATNPAGSWAFAGTPPGSYTLTFEQTGFLRRVVLVEVEAGQVRNQNVTLTPSGVP
jgi:hypothetical protein